MMWTRTGIREIRVGSWSTRDIVAVQIIRIEPDDIDSLSLWHSLTREACTAGRTAAWWRSLESALTHFAHPGEDVPIGDLTRTLKHAGARTQGISASSLQIP